MPEANSSKIYNYMTAVAELLGEVDGIEEDEVIVLGKGDLVEEVMKSVQRSKGQAVSVMPTGASNPNQNAKGPSMTTTFQVTVYDSPNMRRSNSRTRHAYELVEDISRKLHKTNILQERGLCEDTLVTDWFVEPEEAFNIYTVTLSATFRYSPL